jgi:hypothetical protein
MPSAQDFESGDSAVAGARGRHSLEDDEVVGTFHSSPRPALLGTSSQGLKVDVRVRLSGSLQHLHFRRELVQFGHLVFVCKLAILVGRLRVLRSAPAAVATPVHFLEKAPRLGQARTMRRLRLRCNPNA